MFPIIRNVLVSINRRLPQCSNVLACTFHALSKPNLMLTNSIQQNNLLVLVTHNVMPSCGFKVMGRVRRRCKDCYLVRRAERWFVICKTHPRHKQMSTIKDPKNTWLLSHATQSKVRPW